MTTADIAVRIILAVLFGGLIGLERELRDRAAGFRTHILVSVGATAFTIASTHGFDSFIQPAGTSNLSVDPARIAAQIVSGIGFLGAGAIIRHGISVRGLTTAASLWAVAAVGMATGLGLYQLAGFTAVVVVVSLYALRFIEGRLIYPRVRNLQDVEVRFRSRGFGPLTRLVEVLDGSHIVVQQMTVDPEDADTNTIRLVLQLPRGLTPSQLAELMAQMPDVERITMD